ncbi:MAG: 23S rRNA (uracil(1939)-C(5))-methyltransferase RlmD [Lachnospiraceae bacterium]|nr:23S rRNA (uracil(1939)-C(5))-methyltransferase RlmD [Lachnospiraceae bacterium]
MEYKKNDYVTVKIEDIGTEGEGIGKIDGFTLFVKDAVVGDLVEAKILKPKKNYAYARLEKVLEPSPFRVTPKCTFHRQCGGCQLQSLSYEKQLEFKQQKIRNNLIRIGGFTPEYVDERMEPIVGMEEPFYYRNKAQYPVGTDKNGEIITGFYAGRTHDIIANTECHLGVPENNEILEIILDYMKQNQVTAYDEATGQGLVRHVLIRKGFTSGELMVCLVINRKVTRVSCENGAKNVANGRENSRVSGVGEFLPTQEKLLERLAKVKGMTSVSVSINTEKTNVIMGKEIHTLWGEPTISDTIHVRDMQKEGYPFTGDELVFKISPLSFYQVNPVQTEKLYSLALEYAGLTGQETVWDLYCGIGTISLFLAKKAGQVYGVEIVPQAIEDARENAKRNNIDNATFFVGKAEEVLPEFYEKGGKMPEAHAPGTDSAESGGAGQNVSKSMLHPDVIVVDPPRKGCDEACLSTMLKMQPERIVYVSCDSATLARDLKILCEGGYEVKKVRGVDQFGMTVHVETVVCLSRKEIKMG